MNVSLKNNDAVSGIVKLEIVKADYADQVDKSLRSLRQKANVPGFRKGMVPMGMVKKMYGKHVLVEEINKLVSENLFKYIRENDLHILGEPMPNETEQKPLDFDKEEDFEFCFDVALAPEINIALSKNDKLPFYQVDVYKRQIEERLKVRNPIYFETASYGHMGRKPQTVTKTFSSRYLQKPVTCDVELFTWEKLDYADKIKDVFGL